MRGKPSLVDRLHRFYAAGGPEETRQVRIAHDPRDRPPWTVEVVSGRRTLHVRPGATLQSALTAALDALSAPVPPLRGEDEGIAPPRRDRPGD